MWFKEDVRLVMLDREPGELCRLPYPNHPKGCPNYGKKDLCPPRCPKLEAAFRMDQPFHLVWMRFDIGSHARRMKALHPEWSERQCYCCLYWQGTVRSRLRDLEDCFLNTLYDDGYYGHPECVATQCAEAMGVNLTETMKLNCDIELEWPPKETVYKISLIGTPTDEWRDKL